MPMPATQRCNIGTSMSWRPRLLIRGAAERTTATEATATQC